jgi:putative PIN family toxin of toxin-antitoxin system
MKVIIDTNVFVSGIFFSGPPHIIIEAWRSGKIKLVISPEIYQEYQRVSESLAAQFPAINIQQIIEIVALTSEVVSPARLNATVCADPDDDKFIACALASKSRIIVSGDKHLLQVSGYHGIQVLKPREFIDKNL